MAIVELAKLNHSASHPDRIESGFKLYMPLEEYVLSENSVKITHLTLLYMFKYPLSTVRSSLRI